MKRWFLLPTISAPMPFQMALDEVLFRALQNPVDDPILNLHPKLRFYFSSEPWITVGYSHQNTPHPNPLPASGARGKSREKSTPLSTFRGRGQGEGALVCRRITGGGQVLHGKDLIFSIVAHKEDNESFGSVRISYLKIHEAVKAAFEELHLQPRFYRCDEKLPKGKDCFRFPIATDLAVDGRKVAGGAQKRSAGVLLHQESVQLINGITAKDFTHALRLGCEKIFQTEIQELDLTPGILMKAESLAKEKYKS